MVSGAEGSRAVVVGGLRESVWFAVQVEKLWKMAKGERDDLIYREREQQVK